MKSLPFARSAKAARKPRRANLNLMPNWADVELEKKALLAVVVWDGGAGTMNWGDAANWGGDNLPTPSDDVVIPDLTGVQTIQVNTSATVLSLNSAEGVTVQGGQWLTINGGTSSQVGGLFTVQGGFVASNVDMTFLAQNTANLQNAYVSSQYGANVTLGGLADAYNSALITNYGGMLALPDLIQTSYTSVGANWDGDGSGRSSLIDVPKLETGHDWSNFRALDGGVINSPVLKNIDYSYVWIRGANSTMNLQGVSTLNDTQITLDNQSLISSLPVTGMTNGSNIQSDGSSNVSLPLLTSLSYSGLHARLGGVLTATALTDVTSGYFGANWDGDGSQRPSVLNLPVLQNGGGNTQYRALDGGVINVPGLNNLDGDNVWIRGANSTMNLSNITTLNSSTINLDHADTLTNLSVTEMTYSTLYLQSSPISSLPLSVMQGSQIFSWYTSNITLPGLTTASDSTFRADFGGVLSLPMLSNMTNGSFGANWDGDYWDQRSSVLNVPELQGTTGYTQYRVLDGGRINSPKLNNLDYDNVYILGANSTMNLSNVTTLNSSYLDLDHADSITTLSVTNMTWSSLYLQNSPISTLPLSVMQGSQIYSLYSSNVSLPSLTTANGSTFRADYGGVLSLSVLNNATDSAFGSNWYGDYLDQSASVLNLPELQQTTGYGTYRALDGGRINSPKLNNLDYDNVYVRGANATMNLSNVTALFYSYVTLENASSISNLSVSNMTGSTLYLQCSPISTLPLSMMQSSTIYSWYTSNITLPGLTTASDSTFRADYGGVLTLPVLSNMTNGGFGSNWDGDYWDQRASVLNAPELQGTTGYTQYRVLDGGRINSPKLKNLDNDNVYVRGANSTMDLPNVTVLNSSYINLENVAAITNLSISNMTGSTLYLQSSPISTLPVSVMQSSTILSWYTSNVTLPNLTTASDSTFRADYGGVLTLPVLSNMTNGGFGSNWDGDYWDQRASVLNAPELQGTTGYTQYRVLDGGRINSPKLNNLDNDDVVIRGANSTMDLSNVTVLNSSTINLENVAAITNLSISNMTGSTLYLQSSPISTLPVSVMQSSTILSCFTSNVTLPNLITASDSTFRADYGGALTLPVLSNMTKGSFGSNWDGDYWDQRASVLNMPELQGTTGYTQYRVLDGGRINSPKLNNLDGDNVYIRGANSTMDLSNVTVLYSSTINLENVAAITNLSISNMTGSTLYLQCSPISTLPVSVMQSSTILSCFTSNVTLPSLTTAKDSTFRADYGGILNLPELTTVSGGSFGANSDGDSWYQRPSTLTLSKYVGNTNTVSFTARDSGVIHVSGNPFVLTGASSNIWLNNSGTIYGDVTLRDGAYVYSYWGDGTIHGNVVNDGGVIVPNYWGSAGKLTITGNFTQTSAGSLNIDLNGTSPGFSYDQLVVGGTATLAGRLNVAAGYTPSIGDAFEVVQAASVVNDFEIKIMPSLYGVKLVESAGASSVTINATALPVLGINDTYANEGDTGWGYSMAFVLSGVAPAGGITINYNTLGGNPGVDYEPKSGSFTVSAGQYSQTVYVTMIGNQKIQDNRLFQLQASATGIAAVVVNGLIYDDDAPASVSFNTSLLVTGPNSTFSPSPSITIRNRYGNYVEGATVNLLVGSGTAGATASFSDTAGFASVTTDNNGTATVPTLTANSKFGSYRLSANGLSLNGAIAATGSMTLVNAGNTGISWDGGAGTSNWDDELNWNEDRLPMSFDDVVIGDLPGSQAIVINSSATVKSIRCAESIRLASSKSLLLTSGNSDISGSLVLLSGSSLRVEGLASLVVSGGSNITAASLTAASGGHILVNGNSTAINPGLYASGNNSTIRVNGLQTIQSNYYVSYSYPRIEAQSGGSIILPDLTKTERVGTGYTQGQISIYGSQSLVSLPLLADLDGVESISVNGGANITLPLVATAKNLSLYASESGSIISLPNLTTLFSNYSIGGRQSTDLYAYSNAIISLPSLTTIALQDASASLGSINIYYQGSRISAPSLSNISGISTIKASSDVTLETSGNLSNNGNLVVYSSGLLSVGDLHFHNTSVALNYSPSFSGNLFLESGASLRGRATIYGNLTVAEGALKISDDYASVFTVYGNYSQSAAGTLEVRIGGCNTTTYNQLIVSGTACLAGSLTGGFSGVDVPVVGMTYDIIKAGVVLNDFGSVNLDQYGWIGLTKTNTANSVSLTTITSNTPPSLWTMNSPAGGPLPAGVTLVGGLVLDMVGINGVRVVSQLSATSLFIGFYDNGTPTSYRGNPGTIGIQTGITANAVNALGGGLKQVAVRMTLWDGDTGLNNFDRNDNTFYLNGVLMGNYSNVTTQQTSTNGLLVYSNNTDGGFRDETLDTGFFYSNSTSFLTSFFNTLSSGNVTFSSYDTDPYDNYYDYTRGIAGGLVNVGLDPNVSPSSILLSSNSIAENQPVGTLVGTLSAVDANVGDTHTFALVAGAGSDGNGKFTIVGNKLYSNAVFDFETNSTYSIRVQVTDNGGLSYEQNLSIVVTNANDAPVNVSAGGPYNMFQGQSVTLSASATDPDANTTLSFSWDINNDGTFGDATGQNPTLTWAQLNALGLSSNGLHNIRVRASDGQGGATDSPQSDLSVNQTVLQYVSGNQTTPVGNAFSSPLKISTTDLSGNPIPNVQIQFLLPLSGASAIFAGGVATAVSDANGIATSASLAANNIIGAYSVTAGAAGIASQTFNLANAAPSLTSFVVQKGSAGRSFVRYVDLAFNTTATLADIVASIGTASPRIRMANTGLDGLQNVNYNLAGKIAAIDAVLAMDFGSQGIGGNRNAANGDGSYLIEMDLDGNGSFETSRRFFRLLGDVNGDKVVDALDAGLVAANVGATGSNTAADVNGDGVVNAADTLLVRRQKGRRITI